MNRNIIVVEKTESADLLREKETWKRTMLMCFILHSLFQIRKQEKQVEPVQ